MKKIVRVALAAALTWRSQSECPGHTQEPQSAPFRPNDTQARALRRTRRAHTLFARTLAAFPRGVCESTGHTRLDSGEAVLVESGAMQLPIGPDGKMRGV